jgi:hypothetical protein
VSNCGLNKKVISWTVRQVPRQESLFGPQEAAVYVMVWESGARAAEEERGRVRRGRSTCGMLPGAVVCLPGRAYRLLMAG